MRDAVLLCAVLVLLLLLQRPSSVRATRRDKLYSIEKEQLLTSEEGKDVWFEALSGWGIFAVLLLFFCRGTADRARAHRAGAQRALVARRRRHAGGEDRASQGL